MNPNPPGAPASQWGTSNNASLPVATVVAMPPKAPAQRVVATPTHVPMVEAIPMNQTASKIAHAEGGVHSYGAAVPAAPVRIKPSVEQLGNLRQKIGLPRGLVRLMADEVTSLVDMRFWVIDNSGSMMTADGNRIRQTSDGRIQQIACTRWEELKGPVIMQGAIAASLCSPTDFVMLNKVPGCEQRVCVGGAGSDTVMLRKMMSTTPSGGTPLSMHITMIYSAISPHAARLGKTGHKVVVVLATDGLPNDRDAFVASLIRLQKLPVMVTIRLCTDDETVVEFYNSLDENLELALEVLDDFEAEATEVKEMNPWITYALPVHNAREFGLVNKLFDLLDERRFTAGEVRDFVEMLLGARMYDVHLPHPSENFDGFLKGVTTLLKNHKPVWDSVKKKMRPWISIDKLKKMYKPKKKGFF